jgi:hypothetical protein
LRYVYGGDYQCLAGTFVFIAQLHYPIGSFGADGYSILRRQNFYTFGQRYCAPDRAPPMSR